MANKAFNWLSENRKTVFIILFVAILAYFIITGVHNSSWWDKPLDKLTVKDLLGLILIHAIFSRSDRDCNCKKEK